MLPATIHSLVRWDAPGRDVPLVVMRAGALNSSYNSRAGRAPSPPCLWGPDSAVLPKISDAN
jgi:hypothetical protein